MTIRDIQASPGYDHRDHQVCNRAAHIAVGVDLDRTRQVHGDLVTANEVAEFWAGARSCPTET